MIIRIRKVCFLAQFIPLWVWSLISAIMFLGGCSSTLPDIRPFAEQTTKMSSAVGNAYTRTETLLLETKIDNETAKNLKKSWAQTRQTLNAVVVYSSELAALADTGRKGSEAADGVANALQRLIGVVGLGRIPENFIEAFKELNKTVAAIRARKSLKDAVGEAHPAIIVISQIVACNLDNLDNISQSAGLKIATDAITTNDQSVLNYYNALSRAENRALEILENILDYQVNKKENVLNQLKQLDQALTKDNLEQREKHWKERSKVIQAEVNRYLSKYQTYIAKETKIKDRTKNAVEIIRKSRSAVEMWALAHGQLKRVLDEEKQMNIVEYASVIQDVHNAYNKGDK